MNTDPAAPFEALVNRSFANRYFTGRDPIGHSILKGPQGNTPARIVGVAADAREDTQGAPPQALIYACGFLRYWPDSDVLVRTRDPAALVNPARKVIHAIEPTRAVYAVRPLAQALASALSQVRFRTLVVSIFSLLALTLAAIGLYGVMAYMVTQRTKEIGVRVALGARPIEIFSEVLRSGAMPTIAGAIVGIVLAALASRLVGTFLYGIRWFDTVTYMVAGGVLIVVALLACLIPGCRAMTVDPVEALRE
jgi:ABC-type lipoprotein release transport system permease subunit